MNIFVYGTLMHPEIWYKVTKENNSCKQALINDYSRSKIKGEVYPGIYKRKDCIVIGKVYFSVSSYAISKLDAFEGERYQRTKVRAIIDNRGIIAETYVMSSKFQHLLTKEDWDYEEFLKSGNDQFQNNYFGFKVI